jgi:hypothetical protein
VAERVGVELEDLEGALGAARHVHGGGEVLLAHAAETDGLVRPFQRVDDALPEEEAEEAADGAERSLTLRVDDVGEVGKLVARREVRRHCEQGDEAHVLGRLGVRKLGAGEKVDCG